MADQDSYPRITLKCACGNEFNANVIRMKNAEPIVCQVCGQDFPEEIAEKFALAFEDLFKVKYLMEKEGNLFHYSFVYKSTFDQPPAPYPLGDEEEKKEEKQ